MLDHYIIGASKNVSRGMSSCSASRRRIFSAGWSWKCSTNLSSMGAKVSCLGVVGNDIWGRKLIEILNTNNISTKYIEFIKGYTTTLKKRIYSNGIQIARVDQEEYLDWNPNISENFDYEDYDVIILSDYSKGVLMRPWFFKPKGINVILDPKIKNGNIC
jgi:D-beta-D-heptose 7-phosphate kinase/D-beta-D-heptose 1-phosphate adenosyltransferase